MTTRAQRNEYAWIPLVIIPKDRTYFEAYLKAMDTMLRSLQEWIQAQAGVTFCRLPAKRINGQHTVQEYAQGNIYLMLHEELKTQSLVDSRMSPVQFGNPRRVYILAASGAVWLQNMAGRRAFNPEPDYACNPLEPWGPGVAGGPSDFALEYLAGRITAEETPRWWIRDPARVKGTVYGATLHEALHCLGVQHPKPEVDGAQAWLSPMGAQWNWPSDSNGNPANLLPREIAEIRGERDVAGPLGTSPAVGSHFFG